MTRKYRGREEQLSTVRRWRSSGMTRAAFCHANQISLDSLRRWTKIAGKEKAATAPRLVRVTVATPPAAKSFPIKIVGAHVAIEVASDADRRLVHSLVDLMLEVRL